MLTTKQNHRLTEVGPGTPGGELLRRYWHPFVPTAQLRAEQVRKVRLLGEDLVAFADRSGDFGLVGDRCAHRLVGMQFGIPEAEGLRCPYHGWLYGADGRCLETPLESPNSRLKDSVRLPAYPVQEFAGLLWAYLGPLPAPELPRWDVLAWPNALRQVGTTVIPCNWLQCQENAADPAHNIYLHGPFFAYQLEKMGLLEERAGNRETHRAWTSLASGVGFDHVVSERGEFGIQKGIAYSRERGAAADAIRWFPYMVFPNYTRVGGGSGLRHELQIRVPVDDTHTYHVMYDIYAAPEGLTAPHQEEVPYYEVPIADAKGEPILDFVLGQDMVMWASQGEVADRSVETLAGTDEAVRRFRDLLEEQIALVEAGGEPMNVFRSGRYRGEMLELEPHIGKALDQVLEINKSGAFRDRYHEGYYLDDHDRYGPVLPEMIELMRQAEALAAARVGG
ncbi:MAG TPA: Rieske 2Fe-2S domain-containing protein [Acidimicrobiales bacterium]|nr:Rieske 2Fe-2S domain-containing protein [Acidimicrobiales bacterium]